MPTPRLDNEMQMRFNEIRWAAKEMPDAAQECFEAKPGATKTRAAKAQRRPPYVPGTSFQSHPGTGTGTRSGGEHDGDLKQERITLALAGTPYFCA